MEAPGVGGSFMHDVVLPKVEIYGWLLAILGFLGYWNQLVAGALLLELGLGTLALTYFLRAFEPTTAFHSRPDFAVAPRPQTLVAPDGSFYYDIVLPKVAMQGSAVTLLGTLFKLLFGAGTIMLVVLPQALRQQLNRRALAICALGGLMLYVPSATFVRQFHHNDPVLAEKIIFQLHHPRDQAAAEAVRQHQRGI
jgi:hypothetical protein